MRVCFGGTLYASDFRHDQGNNRNVMTTTARQISSLDGENNRRAAAEADAFLSQMEVDLTQARGIAGERSSPMWHLLCRIERHWETTDEFI